MAMEEIFVWILVKFGYMMLAVNYYLLLKLFDGICITVQIKFTLSLLPKKIINA